MKWELLIFRPVLYGTKNPGNVNAPIIIKRFKKSCIPDAIDETKYDMVQRTPICQDVVEPLPQPHIEDVEECI